MNIEVRNEEFMSFNRSEENENEKIVKAPNTSIPEASRKIRWNAYQAIMIRVMLN